MIFIISIVTTIYVLLILALTYGFNSIALFKAEKKVAKTKFSVIIPFRNEAENLPELLVTIEALHYKPSHYEIIFVNDDSTDDSVKIIQHFLKRRPLNRTQSNISIINNSRTSNSPKKDAITSAIKISKYDWIVTTDADCVLPKYWLDTFNSFIQEKRCKMVVGPVTYYATDSFLKRFQLLDFLSLIGATIGGFGSGKPFLCNGANLAYSKALFLALNGFKGNDTIASGDDIFLLQKAIKKNKNAVQFLKSREAIVKTKPQQTLKSLISQRKRWAAKTTSYNSTFGKIVGLIVLLTNATLVSGFVLMLSGLVSYKPLLFLFLIKSLVDFLLLFKTARFFKQGNTLSHFVFSSIMYPFFSVYIAIISMFSTYKWKERTFKK